MWTRLGLRYIHMFGIIHEQLTAATLGNPHLSYEQIPQNKERAEGSCAVKDLLRCALSLRCLLEFLVSAPDVLRGSERVLHKLFNVRRLDLEMAGECGLQLRDFQERLLGSPELLLAVFCVL